MAKYVKLRYRQLLHKQYSIISNRLRSPIRTPIKLLNPPLLASCLSSHLLTYNIANTRVTKIDYFDFIPSAMPKQNRQPILNSQKAALQVQHQHKPHLPNIALKSWFETTYNQSINPSSVSRIISSDPASSAKATNRHQEKRRRTENWPELERAIFEWTQRAEGRISISQKIIREKARQYWQTFCP